MILRMGWNITDRLKVNVIVLLLKMFMIFISLPQEFRGKKIEIIRSEDFF